MGWVLKWGSRLSHPKPDTQIRDHDRYVNIKPKPDINKNQLNFYKTFTKASLFLFFLVSLLKRYNFSLDIQSIYTVLKEQYNPPVIQILNFT